MGTDHDHEGSFSQFISTPGLTETMLNHIRTVFDGVGKPFLYAKI